MDSRKILSYILFLFVTNFSFSQVEIDSTKLISITDTIVNTKIDTVKQSKITISQEEVPQVSNEKEEIKLFKVTQKNGDVLIGEILSDDGREVLLNTESVGKIYIEKYKISSVVPFQKVKQVPKKEKIKKEKMVEEKNYILDSTSSVFANRYLIQSNAFPLKKSENYSSFFLIGFDLHFAVSTRFSVGVASSFLGAPMAIISKFVLSKKNNRYLALQLGGASSTFIMKGSAYGGMCRLIGTLGNNQNNFTIAGGFEFVGNLSRQSFVNVYDQPSFLTYIPAVSLSIGGIKQIGEKSSFVFDSKFTGNQVTKNLNTISGYSADGNIVYKVDEIINTNVLFMPGLRYQKSDKKAFQFNINCYMNFNKIDYELFPFPVFTWFRKL